MFSRKKCAFFLEEISITSYLNLKQIYSTLKNDIYTLQTYIFYIKGLEALLEKLLFEHSTLLARSFKWTFVENSPLHYRGKMSEILNITQHSNSLIRRTTTKKSKNCWVTVKNKIRIACVLVFKKLPLRNFRNLGKRFCWLFSHLFSSLARENYFLLSLADSLKKVAEDTSSNQPDRRTFWPMRSVPKQKWLTQFFPRLPQHW